MKNENHIESSNIEISYMNEIEKYDINNEAEENHENIMKRRKWRKIEKSIISIKIVNINEKENEKKWKSMSISIM